MSFLFETKYLHFIIRILGTICTLGLKIIIILPKTNGINTLPMEIKLLSKIGTGEEILKILDLSTVTLDKNIFLDLNPLDFTIWALFKRRAIQKIKIHFLNWCRPNPLWRRSGRIDQWSKWCSHHIGNHTQRMVSKFQEDSLKIGNHRFLTFYWNLTLNWLTRGHHLHKFIRLLIGTMEQEAKWNPQLTIMFWLMNKMVSTVVGLEETLPLFWKNNWVISWSLRFRTNLGSLNLNLKNKVLGQKLKIHQDNQIKSLTSNRESTKMKLIEKNLIS